MALIPMLIIDVFVLLIGCLCFFKPERLCRSDKWKSADGNFEPSEQYIKSVKHRGIIILLAGAVLTACIAVMIILGIREGKVFSMAEFFEWFITDSGYRSVFRS